MIIQNVYDYSDLAEILVKEGVFGEVSNHLTDYIDYDKIGQSLSFDYTKTSKGLISLY